MSLDERIRQHDTGDATTTTLRVLRSYHLNKTAYEDLFPVVEDHVRRLRRAVARREERRRLPGTMTRRTSLRGPQPATIDDLRNVTVRLFDGRTLRWGELTVEDHEQRIAGLQRGVKGITQTIERHRWAIRMIQRHHVRTLDEVGEER